MAKRGRRRRSKKFVYKRLIDADLDTVLNRYDKKTGSGKKGKQKKTTRRQTGGMIPWVVDFKKGGEIISDLFQKGFKPVDHDAAKKAYNRDRAAWTKSGQGQSWEDWARAKRKIEDSKCTIL